MTSRYRVSCADCLAWLPAVESGTVDLAVADPPYNIGYEYDSYDDRRSPRDYLQWCRQWLEEIHRTVAETGSFWLYIGDEYVSELDVQAKEIGFYKRSHVVHYYTFGVACSKNFARSHTHLLYYTKSKTEFTFNAEDPAIRVPSARQLVYNDKRANPKGKLPDNTWVLSPVDLKKAFESAEDTWLVSRVCGTFQERVERGTYGEKRAIPQMPEKIAERIIRACSNPGDRVMDPFLGTGTTGAVAVRLGRRFLGCEISRAYTERALQRIEAAAKRGSGP